MTHEQMIAWLMIEGWYGASGPELDWIYKPQGPWAFIWRGAPTPGCLGVYGMERGTGHRGHADMLREYQAKETWPVDNLRVLVAALKQEGLL